MEVMFRMVPDQPSWRSEDFCRRGRKAAVVGCQWLRTGVGVMGDDLPDVK